MKFKVDEKVFDMPGGVCFGVVIARGIDNSRDYPRVNELLDYGISIASERFLDKKVKEDAGILPYREAFTALGINPNKFMSSIEALFTRISKCKGMPHINPIVDLGNAMSLKYVLPMGAHDIDRMDADMEVRFSNASDSFLPFGETQAESMPEGELVYVVGNNVRTRRWIWRQSELGKIDEGTSNVFYPIDGFACNKENVLKARDELFELCKSVLGLEDVRVAFIDENNREVEL